MKKPPPINDPLSSHSPETIPSPRRHFIAILMAVAGGAAVILGPLGASLGFILSPLVRRQRTTAEKDGYVKLCLKASDLNDDGTPQQVCVTRDSSDAWNRILNQPVGNVWLRKDKSGEILAFSSICPHLGCSVEHRKSEGDFFCPCHNSTFSLDGAPQNKIPPRPLDSLSIRVEQDVIWIHFQQFRGGISEKVAT